MGKLKNTIKARNEKDWEEEVYMKSTLKWYGLANDGTGVERYVRSVQGPESEVAVLAEDWLKGGATPETTEI